MIYIQILGQCGIVNYGYDGLVNEIHQKYQFCVNLFGKKNPNIKIEVRKLSHSLYLNHRVA